MSEAVFVYLWGGLGNQLFQYAAGMAIVEQLSSELYLLPAQENGHSARDYRRGLMQRGRPADAHVGQLTTDAQFWPSDSHAAWSPVTVRAEVEGRINRLLVRGYFQYLPAIEPQVARIRSDILDRMVDVRHGLAVKYRIRDPRGVASLHVRRGDYVGLQGKGFHLLGPEYYVPAIAAVQASAVAAPPSRWLIFSNDPAWCRSQRWLPPGAEVVEESDEVATLLLLSLCQAAAVTSNSTFSWWGAVLAAPSTVTYPRRWIGDATPALFPRSWVRI